MTPADLKHLLRTREPAPPRLVSRRTDTRDGWTQEELVLALTGDEPVRGFLTRPARVDRPLPAVIYCHAHGARYTIGAAELVDGRPSLIGPLGPLLAERGFVTLCIDMPTFGERAAQKEDPLAKELLWRGRTLMGEMLSDLLAAFAWLAGRDDVDPARVAAFGLSMGATHAYFLAALEPRIARVAHLCCFADLETLIATGVHDLHGHYMTVPGLAEKTTFGRIAGMVAPRPQLICIGDRDPLTPPPAVDRAFDQALAAYRAAGAADRLTLLRQPESGHVETPEMRRAVLEFLDEMR